MVGSSRGRGERGRIAITIDSFGRSSEEEREEEEDLGVGQRMGRKDGMRVACGSHCASHAQPWPRWISWKWRT